MGSARVFSRDDRHSALYLVAHQGPLRKPRPVEIQHMRIRRYIDLLRQLRGVEHRYSEGEDIYIDFNLTGTGQFPGLMRLGERISQHKYRAVFVDLVGQSSFPGDSFRDTAYSKLEYTLAQLPIEVIDISRDPSGVLVERLSELTKSWARVMCGEMVDASHDMVCFFPALSAQIIEAAFFQSGDQLHETVSRRIEVLSKDNPYSGGREPWLPEPLWYAYRQYERQSKEEENEARRAKGEALYRVAPGDEPKLIDQDLWGNEPPRTPESLAAIEARLHTFGFEKHVEGQVVSYERQYANFVLFADPRHEGKIKIQVFRFVPATGKRGSKPKWHHTRPLRSIPDTWWKANAGKEFEQFLANHLPEDNEGPRN
jgi:hypothetical protein